jgi:hypothetical protein
VTICNQDSAYQSGDLNRDRRVRVRSIKLRQSQSQSQSYFITDGQSVSSSWCRAQSGTFDRIFFFFFFWKVTVLS